MNDIELDFDDDIAWFGHLDTSDIQEANPNHDEHGRFAGTGRGVFETRPSGETEEERLADIFSRRETKRQRAKRIAGKKVDPAAAAALARLFAPLKTRRSLRKAGMRKLREALHLLLEYNQYHDELGRFASGDSGGVDREQSFHSVSGSPYAFGFGGVWETAKIVGGGLPGIRMQTSPQSRNFTAQLQSMPATHLEAVRAAGGVIVRMDPKLPSHTNGEFGEKSGIRISTQAKNPEGTLIHEFGHAVDQASAKIAGTPIDGRFARLSSAYVQAVGSERVSKYGQTNAHEAFAEAYAMYASPAGRSYMEKIAPKSKAFMETVFKSDLSKQSVIRSFFPGKEFVK